MLGLIAKGLRFKIYIYILVFLIFFYRNNLFHPNGLLEPESQTFINMVKYKFFFIMCELMC